MARSILLTLLLVSSTVLGIPTTQTGLSDETVAKVKANLAQIATHSWEIGTQLETLIELEWRALSIFDSDLPPPSELSVTDEATDVITKATEIVNQITDTSGPLVNGDGAVGDPASLGVAVLLANWTRTNLDDHRFSSAASSQLRYLMDYAPRTQDGAISHRADQVQLWADFVYMAPPFIAYYGALQGGSDGANLLQLAYTQCELYRQYLADESGLWKHIVLGDSEDNNHWGTGNAWAAAGMLRVLETIRRSPEADNMLNERLELTAWINEILTNAWTHQQSNGTLFNYIDQDVSTTFADTSGTALLAAVTYRMATLSGELNHISSADDAFKLIQDSLTDDGWLLNTVDPLTFNTPSSPGVYSPEGQAFVLLLQAAWRDFADAYDYERR
ncbi:Six-hairpin glycosidase [Daedaleopsis nitida]|nr:Six-hairpin glycosidase [Daedaleopsis nitida]